MLGYTKHALWHVASKGFVTMPVLWVCRCREAGIAEFLVKPFRVEDLKRVMQTCGRVMPPASNSSAPTATGGGAAGTSHLNSAGSSNALGTGRHSSVVPATATTASS
jgi:hypothetical protein